MGWSLITRVGQPASPLCGSVRGEGSEKGLCCCLASGGLLGTCSIPSHFTHSSYVTGTLPAVALVLNSRVGGFVNVLSPCRPFKGSFLKIWQFLLTSQSSLVLQTEVTEIYVPGAGNLGCAVWSGAGLNCSPDIPPDFSTTRECGTSHTYSATASTSLPHTTPLRLFSHLTLQPIWMNVASLNPWLLDFHTVRFSDSTGCYLF